MLNKIPFLGWLLSFIFNTSVAIPFWFFWTHMGLGRRYFYFVPGQYFVIPFWHCVGLFVLLSILGGTLKSLVPTLVNIKHENTTTTNPPPSDSIKTLNYRR